MSLRGDQKAHSCKPTKECGNHQSTTSQNSGSQNAASAPEILRVSQSDEIEWITRWMRTKYESGFASGVLWYLLQMGRPGRIARTLERKRGKAPVWWRILTEVLFKLANIPYSDAPGICLDRSRYGDGYALNGFAGHGTVVTGHSITKGIVAYKGHRQRVWIVGS